MRLLFADTGYWIALIAPRDSLHVKATLVSAQLAPFRIVTSEMVLAEVLNAFGDKGQLPRGAALAAVQAIVSDPSVDVVPQTRRLFQEALTLYGQRPDKGWSLTDCASFIIMKDRSITEALTPDHHFEQAGYIAQLK
jgi:predicted nucleic acid-binding protein